MINAKTLGTLEYNKILEKISGYADGEGARGQILTIQPAVAFEEAEILLRQTQEAVFITDELLIRPSFNVDDVRSLLTKAEKRTMLQIGDLLKISAMLRVSDNVRSTLQIKSEKIELLPKIAEGISPLKKLYEDIDFAFISDTEVNSKASVELYRIRTSIAAINEKIRKRLQSYLSSDSQKYLMDALVTMRNDRFVLPVRSDSRSFIHGIIHDQSASGATVYVEPFEIVEMNNTLRTLLLEEKREIDKILMSFTTRVNSESDGIENNFNIVTALDIIFARADYSREIKGIAPKLNQRGYINIIEGRHPLIDPMTVVPIDVHIGDSYRILVITGPNTGGKTVTLKLVGLFTALALSGLFLPSGEQCDISYFEDIYCDIGDEQSIEQSLSTFSSHIANVVKVVDNANSNTLVLLDELGAGTDPEEGQELAVAVTEYLRQSNVTTIVTSHFSKMKEYSMTTAEAENASMDFDPNTFAPTYRLIIGIPGTSNAIEIATRLGLNSKIISMAKSKIKTETVKFEQILQKAEALSRECEEKKKMLDLLIKERELQISALEQKREQYEKDRKALKTRSQQLIKSSLEDAMEEADSILEKIKLLSENPTVASVKQAKQLKNKLSQLKEIDEDIEIEMPETIDELPKAGDWVYISSFDTKAQIRSITKNGDYEVRIGNLFTRVRLQDIKKLKEAPIQTTTKEEATKPQGYVRQARTEALLEIKLLGHTREEAYYKLDDFLQEAADRGQKEVKIIHGIGTGILSNGIWDYLASNSLVKDYRYGGYYEGGRGVTIVTLN